MRRPAPGLRRRRPATTATCRSRSIPTSPSTPSGRWSRRASTGSASTAPNLMIKIPGTARGHPGDRGDDLRGAATSTSRSCSPSPRTSSVAEAFIRGLERRLAEGKTVDVQLGRVVLRLARRHRGRQAPRGRSAAPDLRGRAGLANARAAYRRFKSIFHGERFAELRGGGRLRPAAAVGLDRREEPELPGHDVRRRPGRARDGEHDADGDAARRRRPRERRAARTVEHRPRAPTCARWPRPASTSTTSPRKLLRDGVDEVRRADGQAPRRASTRSARRSSPRARRRSRPTSPTTSSRGSPSACARRSAEDVAHRIWKKDDDALGPGRPGRGRRPARLADDRRHDARGRRRPRGVRAPRSATRATTDVVLLGMGGSSLAPEVIRLSFGDQDGLARAARARLDRRGRDPRDPATASTSSKTLFLVSTKSGGTIETLSLFRLLLVAAARGPRSSSRSPTRLRPRRPRERARLPPHVPQRPRHRRALQRAVVLRARARGADGRRRRGLLDRAGVAEQNCLTFDSLEREQRPLARPGAGASSRSPAATSSPTSSTRRSQSFGLWVEQLIAESTGKHGKGIVPIVGEPLGDPADYGDDRTFLYLRHVDEPDPEHDAKSRRAREGRATR